MLRSSRRFPFTITLLTLAAGLLALFVGCSGGDDPAEPWTPSFTFEEIQEALIDPQQVQYDHFLDLVSAGTDTAAALDSLAAAFRRDPDVAWCEVNRQGVAVKYANGLYGGVFVDPLDHPEIGDPAALLRRLPPAPAAADRSPDKALKRAIFLNPHYSDRAWWSDIMIQRYTDMLPAAGFAPPEIVLNGAVTLEKLQNLTGNTLIHFYSHGCAFPNDTAPELILLMTGSTLDRATWDTYGQDFEALRVVCLTAAVGAQVFVAPKFITHHNNLGGGKTLVYGGFCYSNMGSWPSAMMAEGVGGYFGFDWKVLTSKCNLWNLDLMIDLLDVAQDPPVTANAWMNNSLDKWYWDEDDERPVYIDYTGNPRLTLRDAPSLPCSETAAAGISDGYLKAYGTYVTSEPLETPLNVTYLYKKIHCDGSIGTAGPYYGTTRLDGYFSSPMTAIFSLGNHQEQVVVEVTIRGYMRRVVIDYDDFFLGDMTGRTLLTPRLAEVNFGY